MKGKAALISILAVTVLATVGAVPQPTAPFPVSETAELREAVTVRGMLRHLRAWQRIADENGGVRAAGTPGYDLSAAYVMDRLGKAGFDVTEHVFDFLKFDELSPPHFEQVDPNEVTYERLVDFATMDYSGSGDVTSHATPVDVQLGPGNTSTSGCEPEDFDGFPEGDVAVIQRGFCTFDLKAQNAENAGAVAAVIFNQGNTPDREGLLLGTLGAESAVTIPTIGIPYALGVEFVELSDEGLRLHVVTDTRETPLQTSNILAETPWGDPNSVIMVGGHLDSVDEGPGIQDNGTGSAAILEIALQMARLGITTRNKIRFAWWGAEEAGLVGSNEYVFNLTEEEAAKIKGYLNFDMIGSPNYVRFIYDGDGSAFGLVGPPGSAAIERAFQSYYTTMGFPTDPTPFSGRSDYQAFILVGIPAGGLFTGAEGIKTPRQERRYGGEAGQPYDHCYHQACDRLRNVNPSPLDQNSDAIAHLTQSMGDMRFRDEGGASHAGRRMEYRGDRLFR